MYLSLRSVRIHLGLFTSALLLTCFRTAWSHNGALDARGGHDHHSDRYGGYHFHEGLLAGQSFLSPELANAAFESAFKAAAADPDREVPLDDRVLSDFFPIGDYGSRVVNDVGYSISYNEEDEEVEWIIFKVSKVVRVLGREHKSSAFGSSSIVSQSFFLSQFSRQVAGFNVRIGMELENLTRDYARQNKSLIVVAGLMPRDDSSLSVSDTYFKILLDVREPNVEGLAFFVPPSEGPGRSLDEYVVSIDYVEQLTGIDFFAVLEDHVETQVEQRVNYRYWDMTGPPSLVDPISWGKIKIEEQRALELPD